MKTKIKSLLLIFIIALATSFISCSKSDKNGSGEENVLEGYLAKTGFNQKSDVAEFEPAGARVELGYGFIPRVKGKINSFSVKVPEASNNLKVTLWDLDTKQVIATETVTVEAGKELTKTINPITLTKDKEYGISINTSTAYGHAKNDGSITTYPFTVGNIEITGFAVAITGTDTPTLPNIKEDRFYIGDVSFKFQKTE
jgi:hypothetical protein